MTIPGPEGIELDVWNDGVFMHEPLRYESGFILKIISDSDLDKGLVKYLADPDLSTLNDENSKKKATPQKRYYSVFTYEEIESWAEKEAEEEHVFNKVESVIDSGNDGMLEDSDGDDNDYSNKFFDYLSAGEEELIQPRTRQANKTKTKPTLIPDMDGFAMSALTQSWLWHVIPTGDAFKVRSRSDVFKVDLSERTCSCRMWKLFGLPCGHVTFAIFKINRVLEDYVPNWFKKNLYYATYHNYLSPMGLGESANCLGGSSSSLSGSASGLGGSANHNAMSSSGLDRSINHKGGSASDVGRFASGMGGFENITRFDNIFIGSTNVFMGTASGVGGSGSGFMRSASGLGGVATGNQDASQANPSVASSQTEVKIPTQDEIPSQATNEVPTKVRMPVAARQMLPSQRIIKRKLAKKSSW
ncbi:multidrug resistance-associated protein 5 [Tanacetum coccineum]|uniref:Multidrug resistance-associated protein 5 n=1 Tax=Tanacetum coccineum TaxID=301880 RepID=A0ABQ5HWT9_9ASTR